MFLTHSSKQIDAIHNRVVKAGGKESDSDFRVDSPPIGNTFSEWAGLAAYIGEIERQLGAYMGTVQ